MMAFNPMKYLETKITTNDYVDGILFSANFIAFKLGEHEIAKQLIKLSGFKRADFMQSLLLSPHEIKSTRELIDSAFKKSK
jgi:hypothetical protein